MKRSFLYFVGAAVLIFAAAVPLRADDLELEKKVEARLEKTKLASEGEILVSAKNGAVVLDGAVATLAARLEAEKAARKEAKVVENRLRVVPEERTDAEITKDVRSAILRYPFYTVFDSIDLKVEGGKVTLAGSVLRENRRNDVEAAVSKVAGVRELENDITVQPVSLFDDQLRRELYRRIYGSDDFVQYSTMANPPIRIVVDRGRVTLSGYVNSPVQRAVLDSIARQTLAFDVVNNVRIDGEKPEDSAPAAGATQS